MSWELYQLSTEVASLWDLLAESADENGEVDNQLSEILNVKSIDFENKVGEVAKLCLKFDRKCAEIDEEIARLQLIKDKANKARKRLASAISKNMDYLCYKKIEADNVTVKISKSEETIIDDESLIPENLMKMKITTSPDKTLIKKVIKSGQEVAGAHLQENTNINIK